MSTVNSEKVSKKEIAAYSSLNFGYTLLHVVVSTYLLYYFTDVALMAAGSISVIILVVRLFDGLIDPFIGLYMDKHSTKYGKFKGYIYYWCVPFCGLFAVLFTPLPMEGVSQLVFVFVIYMIWSFSISMVEGANLPLLVTMTSDKKERQLINTVKITVAIVASMASKSLALEIVDFFGDDEKTGYFFMALIFAAAAAISMLWGSRNIHERNSMNSNTMPVGEILKAIVQTKEFFFLCAMHAFSQFGSSVKAQAAIYYMKYYVERQDLTSLFLFIGIVSSLSMQPLIVWASRRVKPIDLMIAGFIISVFGIIIIGISGRSLLLLFTGNIIYGMASAFPANLVYYYTANLAEKMSAEKKGSFSAVINSLLSLATRFGYSIGGFMIVFILFITDYTPNTAQGDAALMGIQICFILITALAYISAAVFARLSDHFVRRNI